MIKYLFSDTLFTSSLAAVVFILLLALVFGVTRVRYRRTRAQMSTPERYHPRANTSRLRRLLSVYYRRSIRKFFGKRYKKDQGIQISNANANLIELKIFHTRPSNALSVEWKSEFIPAKHHEGYESGNYLTIKPTSPRMLFIDS